MRLYILNIPNIYYANQWQHPSIYVFGFMNVDLQMHSFMDNI